MRLSRPILVFSLVLLMGGSLARVCSWADANPLASRQELAQRAALVPTSVGADGATIATGERLGQGPVAGAGAQASRNDAGNHAFQHGGSSTPPMAAGASGAVRSDETPERKRRGEAGPRGQLVGLSKADGQAPAPYLPPAVIRAVEPERGNGVRLTASVDVGFTFLPGRCLGGAMRITNDSGRPVVVSFHGPGSAGTRLNGQPVEEGLRYLVEADIEISGPAAVGVHLRGATGDEREAAPQGIGSWRYPSRSWRPAVLPVGKYPWLS